MMDKGNSFRKKANRKENSSITDLLGVTPASVLGNCLEHCVKHSWLYRNGSRIWKVCLVYSFLLLLWLSALAEISTGKDFCGTE